MYFSLKMYNKAYTIIYSIVILYIHISEGSENLYVKTLLNAATQTNRLDLTSIDYTENTEPNPALKRIKEFEFTDLYNAERNEPLIRNLGAGYNVSESCVRHIVLTAEYLVSSRGKKWASQMVDAIGKLGAGVLDGNIKWYGSFDECRRVQAIVEEEKNNKTEQVHAFNGQYCYLSISMQENVPSLMPIAFQEGLCVPDTCSQTDMNVIVYELLSMVYSGNASTPSPYVVCVPKSLELDSKAIVAILILCILGMLMLIGTAYDLIFLQWPQYQRSHMGYTDIQKDSSFEENSPLLTNHKLEPAPIEPGKLAKTVLAFSVYTNGKKLLATSKPAGSITCIHGIRFLSMSWVVLGHGFVFLLSIGNNVGPFATELLHRWTFQAVANALVSVDSFFTLSGLLVTYLTLKELDKKKGKINWFMFYFHRFWRLTPAYMLVLMVDVALFRYFGDGPFWPSQGVEINGCKNSWWKNLLYINNFFGMEDMCMAWSWYLSNDMQFFIVSPLMIVPLFFSPVIGMVVCCVFLLGTMITAGAISYHYDLAASLISGQSQMNYMDVYYVKPYCRIGPYIVGILTGYLLYKTKCRVKLNKYINLAGWLLATFFALIVLYGLYDPDNTHPLSRSVAALYNATNKSVWGACLCWVIFACATGNGGFVNTLLSWSPFVALGRLTYCAYLVHILVIYHFANSLRTGVAFTDEVMIYIFLGAFVISNMVAFVASLTFEAPMMGLEKVVFRREKSNS